MNLSAHYWRLAACFLAAAALVGCTQKQDAPLSTTVRETSELKLRLVPNDGVLVRSRQPIRSASAVRATWEIQTKSDAITYFQLLKRELGPEYHPTSQTDSTFSVAKETQGDSYLVSVTSHPGDGGVVVEVQFVAIPD